MPSILAILGLSVNALAAFRPAMTASVPELTKRTLSRLGDRKQLRDTFDRFRRGVDASGVMDSLDVYTRQALEVLTSGR